MNIKKILALLLAGVVVCSFAACAKEEEEKGDKDDIISDNLVDKDRFLRFAVNEEGTYEVVGFTYGGTDVKEVTIPAKFNDRDVTGIADDAFKAVKTINSIKFEADSAIEYIGEFAFYDCDQLTSIELPATVTSIGDGAFMDCDNLKTVKLSSAITEINDYAFMNCRSLTDIAFHEGITSIGDGAFMGCKSMVKVTLPLSLVDLMDCAFYGCTGLTEVSVLSEKLGAEFKVTEGDEEKTVTGTIGEAVFNDCGKKKTATTEDTRPVFTVKPDSAFAKYATDNDYRLA